jgi:hypothetical protein
VVIAYARYAAYNCVVNFEKSLDFFDFIDFIAPLVRCGCFGLARIEMIQVGFHVFDELIQESYGKGHVLEPVGSQIHEDLGNEIDQLVGLSGVDVPGDEYVDDVLEDGKDGLGVVVGEL